MDVGNADRYTRELERVFEVLPESSLAFEKWRTLVVANAVIGTKVHDARIVATMIANDISRILTFNAADFERFPEIEVLRPITED